MITENDLLSAIAECQGEREPNANTCIKLAAYYTIYNQLFGKPEQPSYSRKSPEQVSQMYSALPAKPIEQPTIQTNSDTEFLQAVNGMPVDDFISLFDELMSSLWVINPRLYKHVMNRVQ